MRMLAFAAALAAMPLMGLQPARATALPGVAPDTSGVQLVSGGCGPYGHRDYYGRCVRNFYPGPGPGFRACPPGFHLGPYGQRCWRNF